MENYLSTKDIALQLNKAPSYINEKFRVNGVKPIKISRQFYYNKKDIGVLHNKVRFKSNMIPSNERLLIVEYFLSNRYNSALDIARLSNVSERRINRIITDFFKNDNCVIAESKINYE